MTHLRITHLPLFLCLWNVWCVCILKKVWGIEQVGVLWWVVKVWGVIPVQWIWGVIEVWAVIPVVIGWQFIWFMHVWTVQRAWSGNGRGLQKYRIDSRLERQGGSRKEFIGGVDCFWGKRGLCHQRPSYSSSHCAGKWEGEDTRTHRRHSQRDFKEYGLGCGLRRISGWQENRWFH